ncbi:hypothetical protein IMCC12053_209 [Celeribacter marinus]|uniref:Uncharacterized protein n=1 Tax=Celeribacter marinus TaxID=1397108 RepID=A0A0N9ZLP0_9RHOB|nr:hypothetical protein IMCC12053_209 [Celeribacter marinus]
MMRSLGMAKTDKVRPTLETALRLGPSDTVNSSSRMPPS